MMQALETVWEWEGCRTSICSLLVNAGLTGNVGDRVDKGRLLEGVHLRVGVAVGELNFFHPADQARGGRACEGHERRERGFEYSFGSDDGIFFSSRRRHTRFKCDWSSDVCSSD